MVDKVALDAMVDKAADTYEYQARQLIEWFDKQKTYIKALLALIPLAPTQVTFYVHDPVTKALLPARDWRWELWWRSEEVVVIVHTPSILYTENGRRWWCHRGEARIFWHGEDVSEMLRVIRDDNIRRLSGTACVWTRCRLPPCKGVPLPPARVLADQLRRVMLLAPK